MALLREIAFALQSGLATTLARPRHMLLIASGFLIAGLTVLLLLTIPTGLRRVAGNTGLADVAVVLPASASDESSGSIAASLASIIAALPGVANDANGKPLIAPQFVVNTRLRRNDGSTATVLVRGVTPAFWRVVGNAVHLDSGVRFHPGHNQLLAGTAATRGFVGLAPGATVSIHQAPWRVTGEFHAHGGFWESELWADLSTLQATYNAQGNLTALWVKLVAPADFAAFNRALNHDPRTQGLHAVRQRKFYVDRTGFLGDLIDVAAKVISLGLGLGAMLAIVNALGLALDARQHDLAILRALGFRRIALAAALLIEVLMTGAVCAAIAGLVGWLAVNGHEVGSSTGFAAIQFRLLVDGNVIGWTFGYLLALGLLAAPWPIVHALRTPLTRALQQHE